MECIAWDLRFRWPAPYARGYQPPVMASAGRAAIQSPGPQGYPGTAVHSITRPQRETVDAMG